MKFALNAFGIENTAVNKFYFLLPVFVLIIVLVSGYKNDKGVQFYSPQKGIYVVDIDTSNPEINIFPYYSPVLETVKDVAEKTNADIAINAGFFDPKSKETMSYIIKDGQKIADPMEDTDLLKKENLKPYLPDILNRSEFRMLEDENGKVKFDICSHDTPVEEGFRIKHSIQAGPSLIPTLKLSEESFLVIKNGKISRHSAGVLRKHARSAIGIKGDHVFLVAVGTNATKTMKELAAFMKTLNVEKAMAFDGGSSTSLFLNFPDKKFNLISAKDNAARKVKSALIIKFNEK